jgi:hypothetical protein
MTIERPAAAIEHDGGKWLQTPEFLQRMAVRCDAFEPALHGCDSLPRGGIMPFSRIGDVIRCRLADQGAAAGRI